MTTTNNNKRKANAISSSSDEETFFHTCSHCSPFCGFWKHDFPTNNLNQVVLGGTNGRHCGQAKGGVVDALRDCSSSSDKDKKAETPNPLKVAAGSDGCTSEQCLALVNCLYKISAEHSTKTDENFRLLSRPDFIKANLKEWLVDDGNNVKVAALWGSHRTSPECHALARNVGVPEIEAFLGSKLQIFSLNNDNDSDDEEEEEDDPLKHDPHGFQEMKQFLLTQEQWTKLRDDTRHHGSHFFMSIFTCKNFVDVEETLNLFKDALP